jgi:hypothetical protein
MLRAAKILERMVNQNTYDEIAQGKLAPSHITYVVWKSLEWYFLSWSIQKNLKNTSQILNTLRRSELCQIVVISLLVSTDY